MRHRKAQNKLGRPTDQRVALVHGQVAALFEHGHLNTTLPRAKVVKALAEKLITRAKRGDLSNIRYCEARLPGKKPLQALLYKVAPMMAGVQSGYTNIAKLKYRRGDGALVVRVSLVGREYPAVS